MKKTLVWLIIGAAITLMLMSGMFWLFYTLPLVFFAFAVFYYIVKSSWQRIQSRRK
ncbi:hypothetical protein [Alicyclobacillus fastidiosus]|uniref:Uncharacterized protein n=1 Tax=Alicyclobacillus fastidiosus TaxID=392011 RepID=A0ABV5AFA7_9BACL|nr:hypothetical protein [Alicyclobacillus fastidiosus]WEH09690.1 hypothetical protein PYS47_24140 [Alicyclobacillus fastidiosus]